MTFPIEIITLAIGFMFVLLGLLYLGLRIAGIIWRFTVTVHRNTFIKEVIQFALVIVLLGVIDTNCTPGTLFYPVWQWAKSAFPIIASIFLILGAVYLIVPNMPGKNTVEDFYALPILNSFLISPNAKKNTEY